VIANGGVECAADALQLLASSGCAAVMSSEALLENPALFAPAAIAAAAVAAAVAAAADQRAGGASDSSGGFRGRTLGVARADAPSSQSVWRLVAAEAQGVAASQLAFAREYLELAACLPPAMDAQHQGQYGSTLKAHLFKLLHQVFVAHPDLRESLVRANSPADVSRASSVFFCILACVGISRALK
jgi:tRNA-dihydrouridine synthase